MTDTYYSSATVLSTSIVSLLSGFALGVYAIRGYLISPALRCERARNLTDPVESEESDIDEAESILDHAPNWANGEEADRRQGLRASKKDAPTPAPGAGAGAGGGASAPDDPNEGCKLVLVVRTDLGMTKGKIAAQCSHATLACYKSITHAAAKSPALAARLRLWEQEGQAKIAVQTKSQEEMMELLAKARSLGLTAEVIADAGRTQIEAGSLTVLGVGPAPRSRVDAVTGELKLL